MGFFKKLLGHSGEEKAYTSKPEIATTTITDYSDYYGSSVSEETAEKELLLKLSKSKIDDSLKMFWEPHLGSIEDRISNFIAEGLLEDSDIESKINSKYTVPQLKTLLDRCGAEYKPKDRKATLIGKLLSSVAQEDAEKMVADIKLYKATDKGQEIIKAYIEERDIQKRDMEKAVLERIEEGDIKGAYELIVDYDKKQVYSRKLDKLGIDIDTWKTGRKVNLILNSSYDDLPYNDEKRREIAENIALSEMLGEGINKVADRLLRVTDGEFNCEPLELFLSENPQGGYASKMNPDKPKHVAALYAHTKMFEASNRAELENLLKKDFVIGIKVLLADDQGDCEICRTGSLIVNKSEVDKLPRLPRHWGCRCLYTPIIQGEEEFIKSLRQKYNL